MCRDVLARTRSAMANTAACHQSRRDVCWQGAQSMGGLMTLHAVLRNQGRLRGVVLTSALINVQYTPILRQGHLFGGSRHVERINEPRSNRWSRAGAFIAWFGLHSLKLGAAAARMQRPCSSVAGCILCSEGAAGSGYHPAATRAAVAPCVIFAGAILRCRRSK